MVEEKGIHVLDTAMQYLTWAIEEIEKHGHPRAAIRTRIALDDLRSRLTATVPGFDAEEANRFRDRVDKAEQLADLAETTPRREALMKIAKDCRHTTDQFG